MSEAERGLGKDADTKASDPDPQSPTLEDLRDALADFERSLARASAESFPSDEPGLHSGSKLKRGIKRREFRLLRPISRRSDRLAAELARHTRALADELALAMTRIEILQTEVRRLTPGPSTVASTGSERMVDDGYYWSFEQQMRGEGPLIESRLRQYEPLAVGLLDEIGREEAPLWIDLGCGRGEFLRILGEWGWNALGVDSSSHAIERCRQEGLHAILGDALDYLTNHRGGSPVAISGIQLIEHLPKFGWIDFLKAAHELLSPGGAILLETVNAQNPRALSDTFFADVSHTWPAHPETLRLMARHVGFDRLELLFVNHDGSGHAMDYAMWGRKSGTAPADAGDPGL
jgi:SAM-dependent methyltransferase